MENSGSCDQYEGRVHTKEGKNISIVKKRKRRGTRVHQGTTEKRVYQTLEVTSNSTGVLCRQEGWKEANSTGL